MKRLWVWAGKGLMTTLELKIRWQRSVEVEPKADLKGIHKWWYLQVVVEQHGSACLQGRHWVGC
jgi:hypothetical protein